MRLKGLNCIVTGGSSGIGAATVKRFVEEGAQVLIADIDIDAANSFANEIFNLLLCGLLFLRS